MAIVKRYLFVGVHSFFHKHALAKFIVALRYGDDQTLPN